MDSGLEKRAMSLLDDCNKKKRQEERKMRDEVKNVGFYNQDIH